MEGSKAIITVVVPVYNRAHTVMATLLSISGQTVCDFNVILVDNNSADNTREVLDKWAGLQSFEVVVVSETTPGASAARNCGLRMTRTPWVLFFDSDDIMASTHMARVISAIRAHGQSQIIGWSLRYHLPGGRCVQKPFCPDQYRCLFDGTMSTARYCVRTSFVRAAGGWNEGVSVWDDIELGARLLALKPDTVSLGGCTVDVFVKEDSISAGEDISLCANVQKIKAALDAIGRTLGCGCRMWIDLKWVITAANSNGDAAAKCYEVILARNSKLKRWMLRGAYWYVRHGGRGVARILRPILQCKRLQ